MDPSTRTGVLRPLLVPTLLCSAIGAQSVVGQWSVGPLSLQADGVAFDPLSETVWTVDDALDQVAQYDRQGNVLAMYPTPIPPGTYFASPKPVAVTIDPFTGNLWIGDANKWVYEMTTNGATTGRSFTVAFAIVTVSGLACDELTGNLLISQDAGVPRKLGEFTQDGTFVGTTSLAPSGTTDADGIAYDATTDTFYLGEGNSKLILHVDRQGTLLGAWSLLPLGISPEGLAIDPRDGTVFVGDGSSTGQVYELDGILPEPPGLWSYPAAMSVSIGGTQTIDVDVGASYANAAVMVLGSASGTTPGTTWSGVNVPLNADPYLVWTLVHYNRWPLADGATQLDSEGEAHASFVLPPASDPSLAGRTVHHAAIVLQHVAGVLSITRVTSPVSLALVP